MGEHKTPSLRDKDEVYELLEASFTAGAWSLLDVCCMCASSKLLRSAWLQLLGQQPNPTWLVAAVADAAHARTTKLEARATAVVRWLLHSLPEARLAEHPSIPAGLLAIPRMPKHLAQELCRLGVKVPYKGIVAAARHRVPGVEVWITAKMYMGLASDIPKATKALYSAVSHMFNPKDAGWVFNSDVRDLLHLSINSIDSARPVNTRSLFNALDRTAELSTAETLELLPTAVERNHISVLGDILQCLETTSMDELTSEQLLPIITRAIVLDASGKYIACFQREARLQHLVVLPGAKQLPADAVAALINKVLEVSTANAPLHMLCELPAAMRISPAQLSSIVVAAAARGDFCSLQLLRAAPAFHQLQPAAVSAAVEAAVRAFSVASLGVLLRSRAAAAADDVLVPALVLTLTARADAPHPLVINICAASQQQILAALQLEAAMAAPAAPAAVAADLTARMLLLPAGMEAAVGLLLQDDHALQQQLDGVRCTPCSSNVELLQRLHTVLLPQLLQRVGNWDSQCNLSLLHLAGLVAGAVNEAGRQQQQQQKQ
uniref:Uncharacterized protein n=1 Tax=Tetradesmus obliquus TaxID=3088 RepID=A0A383WCZ8_TETOB|eukprot:jgi/Sobl393_1/5930/SZX75495.1